MVLNSKGFSEALATIILVVVVFSSVLLFKTCINSQQRAKHWGGEYVVQLPSNMKTVNATWKENDLWVLVRPMQNGEEAETFTFLEESSLGMFNGKVFIKESK